MADMPKTMRAWVVAKNGAPGEALMLRGHVPMPPLPTGSNVLIKVSYAGLNPADLNLMANVPCWLPFRRHATPGLDFAGEVVRAGPAAPAAMMPGTEVCGALGVGQVLMGAGSLAGYIVVPANLVARKPHRSTFAAAVGLGVAGQTAALVMREADLHKHHRVLINGASGGVGSFLVQRASAQGATVIAICSASNEGLVRRLGADHVVDYTAHDNLCSFLTETYREAGLDFIFDCVGVDALFTRSTAYLKPEGRFISIVGGKTQGIVPYVKNKHLPVFLGGTPRAYSILGLAPSGVLAREVARWIDDGLVREVLVDSEFTMDDAVHAYERLETKRAKGKIIVRLGHPRAA